MSLVTLARYHLKILGNEIIGYEMHASFSFYHSNLQLAYTTEAWILKLRTCTMQAMHIQMHHTSL